MSVIKARLRKQEAEFISLREVFELLMKDGEGCSLADAAKFLCQVEIVDPIDFLPNFIIYDRVFGDADMATRVISRWLKMLHRQVVDLTTGCLRSACLTAHLGIKNLHFVTNINL